MDDNNQEMGKQITLFGLFCVLCYVITKLLNYYGVSLMTYQNFLVFYVILFLAYLILPRENETV